MKKYVKPELFYERYELAQHIADCQWEMRNPGTGIVTWNEEANCIAYADESLGFTETLFTTTKGCDLTTDNGVYQDYCYQNGASGIKIAVS